MMYSFLSKSLQSDAIEHCLQSIFRVEPLLKDEKIYSQREVDELYKNWMLDTNDSDGAVAKATALATKTSCLGIFRMFAPTPTQIEQTLDGFGRLFFYIYFHC